MNLPSQSSVIAEIRKKWKPRKLSAHKGDFGKVAILAGSEGMTGAASLVASATLACGGGLISLGVPRKIYPILAKNVEKEIMVKPFPSTTQGVFSYRALAKVKAFLKDKTVIALGPGGGQANGTKKLMRALISESTSRIVIDADALNALKSNLELLSHNSNAKVLTPHMGEYLRLFGGSEPKTLQAKVDTAKSQAKEHHITLVLKGQNTVVANEEGRVFVNPTGNPGMASGGMGDVLTGMIAAFLGQHRDVFEASCWAVFLHGYIADQAVKEVGEVSLKATDVIQRLPFFLNKILKK